MGPHSSRGHLIRYQEGARSKTKLFVFDYFVRDSRLSKTSVFMNKTRNYISIVASDAPYQELSSRPEVTCQCNDITIPAFTTELRRTGGRQGISNNCKFMKMIYMSYGLRSEFGSDLRSNLQKFRA